MFSVIKVFSVIEVVLNQHTLCIYAITVIKINIFSILVNVIIFISFPFVVNSRYDGCTLPQTLHGEWFSREDGLNNFITVDDKSIQGRGRCVEYLNTNNDNFTILLHHE